MTALLVLIAISMYEVAAVAQKSQPLANPDQACKSCHQAIYTSYEQTPMARGSGPALAGLAGLPGENGGGFTHTQSGVEYRVFERDGQAWLSYTRDAKAGAALSGERQLEYFIGSGKRGRTYLYQQDSLWFEAPINYYTRKALWDMAPAYGAATAMPDALPVDPNCLHCHASQVATAEPQARNKFAGAPFAQGGVGCSGCHGDPAEHLRIETRIEAGRHKPLPSSGIVNPDKLDPARRDSACLQCHLEGDAAIYRAGSSLASFVPGERLDDHAVYFVRASREAGGGRASSQYEALLRSACKRASGDRLTCTTCHDPHSTPAPTERVAFYRAKCLACHTGPEIAVKHHPEQQDCASCHMPTRDTTDISHEQLTDHNIETYASGLPADPALARFTAAPGLHPDSLKPVGATTSGPRELGLAYAQMAERGDRASGERALVLLAEAEAAGADDAPLHVALGFLRQMSGDPTAARAEYVAALRANPWDPSAAANLAVLDARAGQTEAAVKLLDHVVSADPSQMAAGLNLAFIECRLGDKQKARAVLDRIAAMSPDDPALRQFLATGNYGQQQCPLR
jgi:tetratricopeptide (TPR) repeat protein